MASFWPLPYFRVASSPVWSQRSTDTFAAVMLAVVTQMVTQTDMLLRTGIRMAPTAAAEVLEDTEEAPTAVVVATKCQILVQA